MIYGKLKSNNSLDQHFVFKDINFYRKINIKLLYVSLLSPLAAAEGHSDRSALDADHFDADSIDFDLEIVAFLVVLDFADPSVVLASLVATKMNKKSIFSLYIPRKKNTHILQLFLVTKSSILTYSLNVKKDQPIGKEISKLPLTKITLNHIFFFYFFGYLL